MKASISKYVPLCSPQSTNLNEKAKLTFKLGNIEEINGTVVKAEGYNIKGRRFETWSNEEFFYLNFPLSEKLKLTFNLQNSTWVVGAVVKEESRRRKGRRFGIPPG